MDDVRRFLETTYTLNHLCSPGPISSAGSSSNWFEFNEISQPCMSMYCPQCGDERKMSISKLYERNIPRQKPKTEIEAWYELRKELTPSLWLLRCNQCDTLSTTLIYQGFNETKMIIIPCCDGGITTKHTPEAIAYYLDQAYKAKIIGANSASVVMFRCALEHLLYEQGYTKGTLDEKIKALIVDIESGKAKEWALRLDPQFLTVIRKLGNGAVHTNGGDIEKQKALDNELIWNLEITFTTLLDLIYEQPIKMGERLSKLKEVVEVFDK